MMRIIQTLILFLALPCVFAEGITEMDAKAFQNDGQQKANVNGTIFTISNDRKLLRNGKLVKDFAKRDVPHVRKIYSVKMGDMQTDHLAVYFDKEDNRLFGHSQGFYFYNPININSWDHIRFQGNHGDAVVSDVTVFNGSPLILYNLYRSNGQNPDTVEGHIGNFDKSSVWEVGGIQTHQLKFLPMFFVNTGEELFIIGKEDDGTIRKYQYVSERIPDLYINDVSVNELKILQDLNKK